MATNQDSFTITAAMLTPAWVKPTVSFTTATGEANATDAYLPRTLVQKAGSPGSTSSAVQSPLDPNYAFAATMDAGQERTPYPNTVTTVAAVDSIPTLSVTNVES